MNGNAATSPRFVVREVNAYCRQDDDVARNIKIGRSPVLSAVFQSAVRSMPSHHGGSIVSRFT
jgi:hypothetical protein